MWNTTQAKWIIWCTYHISEVDIMVGRVGHVEYHIGKVDNMVYHLGKVDDIPH